MKAKIHVAYKKEVLDPQGKAIRDSLEKLGFKGVLDSRCGKFIELTLDQTDKTLAEEAVHSMCKKLLSNPVIEDYSFVLEDK